MLVQKAVSLFAFFGSQIYLAVWKVMVSGVAGRSNPVLIR